MSEGITRRQAFGHAARGAAALGIGATAIHLVQKADGQIVWQLDTEKCVNSRLGAFGVDVCGLCRSECVVALSAIRAVNDIKKCGRCYICPAYYNVKSAVDDEGLPSEKLCPRDAIERKPIGEVDPEDPANNFYDYIIDESLCDGCGRCVMGCKEPAGLGSITLQVRHNICVDCNACSIATACPDEAYDRIPVEVSVQKNVAPAKSVEHE